MRNSSFTERYFCDGYVVVTSQDSEFHRSVTAAACWVDQVPPGARDREHPINLRAPTITG
jgi:hypothetical protein